MVLKAGMSSQISCYSSVILFALMFYLTPSVLTVLMQYLMDCWERWDIQTH